MKRKLIRYLDGSHAEIETSGTWTLTLANGEIVRGIAGDLFRAQELIDRQHNRYAVEQWNKGKLAEGGLLVCSLR